MISYLGVIRTVMIADTSQFNRGMLMASQQMRDSALRMRRDAQSLVGVGAALNVGITMPFSLAARSVIRYGAEYQAVMMKMRHVSGLTVAEFKKLEDAQTRISKSVGIDPQKLGKIGYLGAQAQLKGVGSLTTFQRVVSKAMKTMPGEGTPESVAEGFLSVIKAFDIEEKDFSRTMAEMIKTIDLGRISWQEYTTTIQQVVALASSLKTTDSLKKMNISIAAATLGGVSGSKAATAIRNLYRRVYKEGGQEGSMMNMAAGMFGYRDKRGKGSAVKMFEEGAGGDLAKFSQMITAAGKLATPEYADAMGIMAREFTTFLKLAKTAPEELSRFSKEYDNAEIEIANRYIEAQKQIVSKLENLGAAWGRLRAQFLTSKASDMLSRLLDNLVSLFDKIGSLPDVSKNLVILAGALASLGSVAVLLTGVYKSAALTWRLNNLITSGAIPSFLSTNATVGKAASVAKAGSLGAMSVKAANCNVTGRVVNVFGKTLGGIPLNPRGPRGSGFPTQTAATAAATVTTAKAATKAAATASTTKAATMTAANVAAKTAAPIGAFEALNLFKNRISRSYTPNFSRPGHILGPGSYASGSAFYDAEGRFSSRQNFGFTMPNYRSGKSTGLRKYKAPYTGTTALVRRPNWAMDVTRNVHVSPPPYDTVKSTAAARRYKMGTSFGAATLADKAFSTPRKGISSGLGGVLSKFLNGIWKLLPIIGKFVLLATVWYTVLKGLYDFIAALVIPAITDFGKALGIDIKWASINEAIKLFGEGLNAIAKGVTIALGTVTAFFSSVFELIFQGLMWVVYKFRKDSIGVEDTKARMTAILNGAVFKEMFDRIDNYFAMGEVNKELKKFFDPIDKAGSSGDTGPTNNLDSFIGGSAGFYEGGTAAGYEAVQQGRNALIDSINKLRQDVVDKLKESNRLAEELLAVDEEVKNAIVGDA